MSFEFTLENILRRSENGKPYLPFGVGLNLKLLDDRFNSRSSAAAETSSLDAIPRVILLLYFIFLTTYSECTNALGQK